MSLHEFNESSEKKTYTNKNTNKNTEKKTNQKKTYKNYTDKDKTYIDKTYINKNKIQKKQIHKHNHCKNHSHNNRMSCMFCKKINHRDPLAYGHYLKTKDGKITCPRLLLTPCQKCGIIGHSKGYCKTTKFEKMVHKFRRMKKMFT